jgi:hypothetical protein
VSRRPAPLDPGRVGRTITERLAGRVDRLRQLNTRFGQRSRRVFLVWTRFNGEERGEGNEQVIRRVEILPTPRVTDASQINYRPWSGGTMPEGSLRVDEISTVVFTGDCLKGLRFPNQPYSVGPQPPHNEPLVDPNTDLLQPGPDPQTDFFYEVVEDGRGDQQPERERYRLLGRPWRNEEQIYFAVVIEAASSQMGRDGESRFQVNDE